MSSFDAIDKSALPVHVGIIMDGNGRWAQKRALPRSSGHKEGVRCAREIIKAAARMGIRYLTLYTFSTENWKRTEEETSFLMNLLKIHLRKEFEFYKKEQVRVRHLGDKAGLPEDVCDELESVENESKNFNGMTLVLAINYGAKNEIYRAAQKMLHAHLHAQQTNEPINGESGFTCFFDIPELPDADLIIRTGGEKRLSNFLLWHASYAELDFSDVLWPDYTPEDFYKAVLDFQKRKRRFGAAD
jgi:di-trans,poly-cis-decaprenylcistransferase